jgi:hypothetical protein
MSETSIGKGSALNVLKWVVLLLMLALGYVAAGVGLLWQCVDAGFNGGRDAAAKLYDWANED